MEKRTLQALQTERHLPLARYSKSFDQGRNARAVKVTEITQIDDDTLRRLGLQQG